MVSADSSCDFCPHTDPTSVPTRLQSGHAVTVTRFLPRRPAWPRLASPRAHRAPQSVRVHPVRGWSWGRAHGDCTTERVSCPWGQAVLPHVVTSAQMAGSHLQVPIDRQNEQPLDTSHRALSLRRPPAEVHGSTSGEPAEEFFAKLTRSLQTTLCSCSIHLFLLTIKIRAKFLLLTRLRVSVLHPLPFSRQCKAAGAGAGAWQRASGLLEREADPHPGPRPAGRRAHSLEPGSSHCLVLPLYEAERMSVSRLGPSERQQPNI